MPRVPRLILLSLAGAIFLLVAAVLVVTLVVDPNRYRAPIENAVRDASGRDFELEGDIDVAWVPWLALETGKAQLGNPAGFDGPPLLAWDSARIGVRLWPLIQGNLEVDRVRFDGLRVHLKVSKDGRANWQGFGTQRSDGDARAPFIPRNAGLEVRNAALDYVDERSGTRTGITDWSLDIGAYNAGKPVAVETAFRYRGLPVEFQEDALLLDLDKQRIAAPDWSLRIGEATASGSLRSGERLENLAGDLRMQTASLRALLDGLGAEVPRTRDAGAIGAASLTATWQVDAGAVRVQPLSIRLDDTALTGQLARAGEVPMWTFELRGDRIDLDRYLEPDDAEGKPFELPTAALKAANVRGTLRFDTARLAGVDAKDVILRVVTEEPAAVEPPT
jgi:AsmA protein